MERRQTDMVNFLFLGMLYDLSCQTLLALIQNDLAPVGIWIPTSEFGHVPGTSDEILPLYPEPSPSDLPLLNKYLKKNIVHVAWENNISIFAVSNLSHPRTSTSMTSMKLDLALVSCFPHRISGDLLKIPNHGFLNLHPSLLPDFRGPAPQFWIFQNGAQDRAGVTVHVMDEGLDTGDIICQKPVSLPDGISGLQADGIFGTVGGGLLAQAVSAIMSNRESRTPQPVGANPDPWPVDRDFEIHSHWTARRAFNFMRGTEEWGQPYTIILHGTEHKLAKAVDFLPDDRLEALVEVDNEYVRIRFSDGILVAQLI
jgi:methionyl-tRNA formyltransferase